MAVALAGQDSPAQLRRVLGAWEVTAAGVGIIVGAGIYVLIGEAARDAGAGVWMSFAVAGTVSALTALSYAELASMFPRAGAEFEYSRQVFPSWVSFLVGWMMAAGLVVAAAAVSLGFGAYFREFVEIDARFPAAGLIVALTLVAAAGVRESIRVTVALSILVVGGLIAVIAVGAPSVGDVSLVEGATAGGVLSGAALVFFAFIGFDEVNTLAEETREPEKNIPRAILAGLAISTAVYILVAITAVSAVGPERLASAERPLTLVVEERLAHGGAAALAVIALMATASTALMALVSSSRLIYAMAREGALPRAVGRISRRAGVPLQALVAGSAVALLFALSGDIGAVAEATDVSIYFVFLAVNATLIALRFQRPDAPRPFRVRVAIAGVPVTAAAGLAVTLLLATRIELLPFAVASGLALLGLCVHLLVRWTKRATPRSA